MDKIKEILLGARQHLCNTEFAPAPFDDEPLEPNWTDRFVAQIQALIDKEKAEIFKEIEKEFIWGQVPVDDLEKGRVEWTMHCISEEDWQAFKKGGE